MRHRSRRLKHRTKIFLKKEKTNTAGNINTISSSVVKNTPLQKSFAPLVERAKRLFITSIIRNLLSYCPANRLLVFIPHMIIDALFSKQVGMCTLFRNLPLVNDEDIVGISDA